MDDIEGSPSAASETLVNIDVNSELLEGYMEVCISYRCVECLYTSTDQKTFYEHCLGHLLKEHTASQTLIYLCSTCYKAFNSLEETKQHLKDVHNKEPAESSLNEGHNSLALAVETVDNAEGKKKGRQKRREKLKLVCSHKHCNVSFEKEADLTMHLSCHLDEKMFCCPQCSMLFHTWPNCVLHLDKLHEIDCGLLKCTVCKTYKTWAPLKLENHMRIHSVLKSFSCKICGHLFKQASQLRNHHYLVHADEESQLNWSKSKQCTMCFKMYTDAKALKKHKDEVHSRLRPFVCNVCGHTSARKSMLALHQRQHTGHKPLTCNMCTYKTADHNSLRRHLMLHTGVRPYQCPAPDCPFSTVRSGSLIRHVKQLHQGCDYIYSCRWCPYKTVSNDCYVNHVSDHMTGLIKNPAGADKLEKSVKVLGQEFSAWAQILEDGTVDPLRKTHPKAAAGTETPSSGQDAIL